MSVWKSNEDSDATEGPEQLSEPITTVAPILDELDPEMIRGAIEKAKENLNERKRFEYEAWLERNSKLLFNK